VPTPELLDRVVEMRRNGCTVYECAGGAGVHVATICRWQVGNADFHQRMREAHGLARRMDQGIDLRPKVRWRRDCPLCKARVAVRSISAYVRFWRCGRWPLCPWASWRPRAPRNCRSCGAPCYWSHSRKSIGCSGCGMRIMRP
jgi:hypothetical protein